MRRFLQRLRARLAGGAIRFVYDPAYARTVAGVPLDPGRADEVLAFLLDRGLVRRRDVSRPIPASLEHILRVHTPAYVESLQDPATLTAIFGVPVRPDEVAAILDHERLIVGGTIQATRLALAGGCIAANLKGGQHHAGPARGMGFCVFNDVAVAIRRLRARGFAAPVLVVDLDLHDGNGTRAVFAADPSVHTFSIHNRTWDDAPAASATVIALGEGVTDERYLAVLRDALPPVVERHRPGMVVYIAGADPAADDALGDWKITPAGMLARDQFVVRAVRGDVRRGGVPLVILPGGGYGGGAWRYAARFFAWLVSGRVLEPPDDVALLLSRYRPIVRHFVATAPAQDAGAAWAVSDADLAGLVPGGAAEPRVLGAYSRHALELLLERIGFLPRLRDRGFRHPVLEVTRGVQGETIRVYGDAACRELLMELRVNRNRRVVPGMEVLYVEWLLLQNPRAAFAGRLAPLPGQEHPGLGMLGEVAAWLVAMCEALGLDGIVFIPAHYYMAAIGQHHLRFLDPEDQARFEALRDALAGLSLAAADRAVAEGRVADAATGQPVRWTPAPMVLPVSARLRALVTGPAYEAARARARAARRFAPVAPLPAPPAPPAPPER